MNDYARPRFAHLTPGVIETLNDASRAMYGGLVLEGKAVQLGPCIVANDCLTTPALRVRIFQPFLASGWIISHLSAAWVHWRVGRPFPLCLSSVKRVRATDTTIRYLDCRAPHHLDPTLELPVTTPAYTIGALVNKGLLDDRAVDETPAISAFCPNSHDYRGLGSLQIPRRFGEVPQELH
ncbi:MAG: hypothetical protein Q4P71_05660 [Actinomycetaceae bacterium]|nr:hypothetical protein [Actinomycetaceae bacterium]